MFDFATNHESYETTATIASAKSLAHAFIERLGRDDAFRAFTMADPVAATAQYGFTIDPSKLPAQGITLPSKDVLNARLDEVAQQFAAAASAVIVFTI